MGYREEILTHLYRILENNSTDARVYHRLAEKCKRGSLRNFFKKLGLQKRFFCRRIKYEISQLERQMEHIGEQLNSSKAETSLNVVEDINALNKDIPALIRYCDNRERQYLEHYRILLSKTNLGEIREMLLFQKHSVQLVLNEIKTMQTKNHNAKNEGEINYT